MDGDLDDALNGHDGGGADVIGRRGDGARVPVPLRVLRPRADDSVTYTRQTSKNLIKPLEERNAR